MVVLKNITKNDKFISADYFPEGKENERGFMKVDIKTGEVLEHKEAGVMAPSHAKRELRHLATMDDPPEEKTVLWY
ncbi:MAG: hypothetical protein LUI02_04740 [Clostridiales bacterium]|nr:hypothetical protein [Clostridiales bacterium]